MRRTLVIVLISIMLTAAITFIATSSYIINTQKITENHNSYIVEVFGQSYEYK